MLRALVCTGLVWGCSDASMDAPASEPEEDILSLAQMLDLHSAVFVDHTPANLEDPEVVPKVTGRTTTEHYYGLFRGEAAIVWAWAVGFSSADSLASANCELKAGAGRRTQLRFAN